MKYLERTWDSERLWKKDVFRALQMLEQGENNIFDGILQVFRAPFMRDTVSSYPYSGASRHIA